MRMRGILWGTVLALALTGVAATQEKGKPFEELWTALRAMGARVTTLEQSGHGTAVVVDANGEVVGEYLAGFFGVLRQIDGKWFALSGVSPDGFGGHARPIFYYEQPGCAQDPYMSLGSPGGNPPIRLAPVATVWEGVGYYAGEPIEVRVFRSQTNPNGDCSPVPGQGVTAYSGPVATLDLSTLGVTPPFHIE